VTSYLPVYRMTIYSARSDQSNPTTEPDILSPAAGAPHSESFKLATIQGLSGYKPLMGIPTGKRGRFDPLTCRCETGQLRVPLYDFRLIEGGSQANRWVAGQLGAADGRPLPIGCKVKIEWDPTGGGAGTFFDYWTGRVQGVETDGAQVIALDLVDMAPTLNYKMASGRPHPSATGVVMPSLLPVGLTAAYGIIPAYRGRPEGPLAGKMKSTSVGVRYIEFDATSRSRPDNILSAELKAAAKRRLYTKGIVLGGSGQFNEGLRLRFLTGVVNKEANPAEFEIKGISGTKWVGITRIYLEAIPSTTDPFYTALDTGTIPNDTAVTFDIRRIEEPVYFVVATAAQFLQDIAAGYHGDLDASGAVKRRVAVNAASVAALPSLPTDRWPVVAGTKAQDWIEKYLCMPRRLGYRFNESGELVVFSTALPASTAGLPALTDADLSSGSTPTWNVSQQNAKTAVRVNGYLDIPITISDLPANDLYPSIPAGLIQYDGDENNLDYLVHLPRDQDLDESLITIDALGFRAMEGETAYFMTRALWIREQQQELVYHYGQLYGQGPVKLRGRFRRTTNTDAVYPGTWCLVDLSRAPNIGNHLRGGSRLMMCVERSEDGLQLNLDFLDAGAGVLANSPTLGAPAQESGNELYGYTVSVTLNAQSDPVTVWVNTTATSVGSRPADGDPGWRLAYPAENAGILDFRVFTGGTKIFRVNPPGRRHWLRARSEGGSAAKLNSGWVYPSSGTGYVDTDPMTSVTSVTVSNVSSKKAKLTIVNGDALAPVAILVGNGTSEANADASTPAQVLTLPPGSTVVELTGLDTYAGTWFRVQAAHLDAWGNLGPATGTSPTSFEATGTAATAPAMGGLLLLRGESTSAPPPSTGGLAPLGRWGIELQILPGPSGVGFDVEIRRGTTSGALTLYDKIYAEQTQGRAYVWRDEIQPNDTTYFYDARLTEAGYNAGLYTGEVSDKPGFLPVWAYGTEIGEPVLGATLPVYAGWTDWRPLLAGTPNPGLGGYLSTDALNTGRDYTATFNMPTGSVLGVCEVRLWRSNSGDYAAALYSLYDVTAGATAGSSLVASPGASWATYSDFSFVGHVMTDGETLVCNATLLGVSLLSDARLLWGRVYYVPSSYQQVRAS
jgi:hypothetical protein